MKISTLMIMSVLSVFLAGGIAHAHEAGKSEGMDHQGKMDMDGKKMGRSGGMEMMKARQQLMLETVAMLQATMSIMRDLNHKPSDEERERLDKMIARIDTMMADQEEMQKKMQERMEKRKEEMKHKN